MSLMNPKWKYYPAADTDVSRTFARVKREMAKAEAAKSEPAKVRAIRAPLKKAGT